MIFTERQAVLLNKENIPDCFQNDIRNGEMRHTKVGPYNKKFFFLQGMVLIHMTQCNQKI